MKKIKEQEFTLQLDNSDFISITELTKQEITKEDTRSVIIMCNGFAEHKFSLTYEYAKYFALKNYLVIIFDYRGFGKSSGSRYLFNPDDQKEDIKNVISYSKRYNLPIILWGYSFGGVNSLILAPNEKNIDGLIIQSCYANGSDAIEDRLNDLQKKKILKNCDLLLRPEQIIGGTEALNYYNKIYIDEKIKLPLNSLNLMIDQNPIDCVSKINIPILFICGKDDDICPKEQTYQLFEKARCKKDLLEVFAGHYNMGMDNDAVYKQIISKVLKWINNTIFRIKSDK